MKGLSTIRNSAMALGFALFLHCVSAAEIEGQFFFTMNAEDVGVPRAPARIVFNQGSAAVIVARGTGYYGKTLFVRLYGPDGKKLGDSSKATITEGKAHWWQIKTNKPGKFRAVLYEHSDTPIAETSYNVLPIQPTK